MPRGGHRQELFMNRFDKMERKIGKYAIPHLPLIMTGCFIAGYIFGYFFENVYGYLVLDPVQVVENHQFCTPVRGNKDMKRLEQKLRQLLSDGTEESWSDFNALFLMEHAWAHFFENALSLKHLCDWAVLRKKNGEMIDWTDFEQNAKDVGFWKFAESMNHLADLLCGVVALDALSQEDRRLLDDMLTENKDVSMNEGWKTRFQLFRNFFAQSWKYKMFSNHSAMYCLMRTVNGFAFDRNPRI